MPWFPEFYSAAELARRDTRAASLADPVGQYLTALTNGDTHLLEKAWPGHVVIFDPRAGEVRGHRDLRRFIHRNRVWLAERHARTETVGATRVSGRAVVELLVRLGGADGDPPWPVAVVAESHDAVSVVFRTYCSQLPVDGRRHPRAPILASDADLPGDVVARFAAALDAGNVDAIVATFAPDGYLRESTGRGPTHRGSAELRSFFAWAFSAGGGVGMRYRAVTDDGVRCAVEYDCTRWGRQSLGPQAGLCVLERGAGDLLTAVRFYDDVEPPVPARQPVPGSGRSAGSTAERELFRTIRTTYPFALEPEQQAMVRQLRSQLPTVPAPERAALIDDVESSIGRGIEDGFDQ